MLLKARLLLLLTDQEGLYTRDPRQPGAELVREVTDHRLLDELEVGAPRLPLGLGRHALQGRRRRDGERRRRRRR